MKLGSVFLLVVLLSGILLAQQPEPLKFADPATYRTPKKALLYSLLLPGGGQYYNQYYFKGALLTTAAGGGVALITVGAINQDKYKNAKAMRNSGIAVLTLSSVASMLDAYISARAINSRNGYGKLHTHLHILPNGIIVQF